MQLIEAILRLPSPYIRHTGGGSSFALILTVQEGLACRFAASTWTDQILAGVARDLVREVGWKVVEHASRRQVVLRCTVPKDDAGLATAEIDFGTGYVALPVVMSAPPEGPP